MKLSDSEIKSLMEKYYQELEGNDLDILLSITKYEVYQNKEVIFKSGRKNNCLFFILIGSARAYSVNNKGEQLNDHLRSEGYLFGDPRVFAENEIQILNIEAIGKVHILKFDINQLEIIAFENSKLMRFYLNLLKEIILTFSHRINTFVTMNSAERYEDLIRWNPLYLKTTFDKHLASFLGIKPLTFHRIKKNEKTIK